MALNSLNRSDGVWSQVYAGQLFRTWVLRWTVILSWTTKLVQWLSPAFSFKAVSKGEAYSCTSALRNSIHAFITSWLDYCNALYFGVSQSLACLQLVQKAAAHLLNGAHKREHMSYLSFPPWAARAF